MTIQPHCTIRITLLYALLLAVGGIAAQPVWPGDTNNNGIVSGVDVLYIGWAFGQTGPARATTDTDWTPQPAPSPWAGVFPDGTNFYFADADGNGLVDEDDLDAAVAANFAETHDIPTGDGYANAPMDADAPALILLPVANTVGVGGTARFELWLGNEVVPATGFHGIALHASYATVGGSALGEMDFETAENPWVAAGDPDFLDFDRHYPNDVPQIDVALSRTDRQGVDGGGKLGEYSVIIEDIVVGLSMDTLLIRIDSVRTVGSDGFMTFPVKPTTARVVIAKDTVMTVGLHGQVKPEALPIYPNPAQHDACLPLADGQVLALQLIGADGQWINLSWYPAHAQCVRFQWPSSLPSGAYHVRALTNDGPRYGKLLIIH